MRFLQDSAPIQTPAPAELERGSLGILFSPDHPPTRGSVSAGAECAEIQDFVYRSPIQKTGNKIMNGDRQNAVATMSGFHSPCKSAGRIVPFWSGRPRCEINERVVVAEHRNSQLHSTAPAGL